MSDHRGSLLEILTVALAGVSLLVVLLRAVARHRIARVCEPSDLLLPLALVSQGRHAVGCYRGKLTVPDRSTQPDSVCPSGDLEWIGTT